MEWKTRLTEMLGCRYPIIQGAFGGFGTSAIAAPSSEAGAFGIITAGALRTPEKLREDIARARSMTRNPFGVNLSLRSCPSLPEMRDTAIEERVPVIFTAAYNAQEHGEVIKRAGRVWIHKVAAIKHALVAQRQGADAVVIVGIEGAGFKGPAQLTTFINLALAARYLKIPYVAAGGIADASGFLGALAMGAEGIYLGTAFMATRECPIPDRAKQRLVDSDPYDPEYRRRTFTPPDHADVERVRHGVSQIAPRWQEGGDKSLDDLGKMSATSLAVGVIDGVPTVKEFIDGLMADADRLLVQNVLGKIAEPRFVRP